MEIKIKNIGPISKANIEVSGITVVGAANDSGKSTISKILYATIKAMNNYKKDFLLYKKSIIRSEVMDIIRRFENNLSDEDIQKIDEDAIDIFDGGLFHNSIVDKIDIEPQQNIKETIYWKKLRTLYDKEYDNITEDDRKVIKEAFENILKHSQTTLKELADDIIYSYFKNEFSEITNFNVNENAMIKVMENENSVFDLKINKEQQKNNSNIQVKNLQIEDVTYIEYPNIMQDSMKRYSASFRFRSYGFPFIQTISRDEDLIEKLRFINRETDIFKNKEYDELIKNINHIVGGNMQYSRKNSSRMMFNKNGHEIPISNLAGGIKSFAILEILLHNKILNEQHLLVIDEPEINLHPIWQVKYAEIIVLIHKELKTKFFINTHSSFFIEAIKVYSEKYEINKETIFYTLLNESNGAISKEVKDISEMFEQLNGAFDILDQERLKIFSETDEGSDDE